MTSISAVALLIGHADLLQNTVDTVLARGRGRRAAARPRPRAPARVTRTTVGRLPVQAPIVVAATVAAAATTVVVVVTSG